MLLHKRLNFRQGQCHLNDLDVLVHGVPGQVQVADEYLLFGLDVLKEGAQRNVVLRGLAKGARGGGGGGRLRDVFRRC